MGLRGPVLPALAGAWLVAAGSLSAQAPGSQPSRVSVSVTASTLGLGDLQVQPILAERFEDEAVAESAVLQRTLKANGGLRGNVAVAIALDGSWSVRVGAGAGRVRLDDAYSGPDEWIEAARETRRDGRRDVGVTGVEAALRFRLPSAHTFRPYIEVGVAAERWGSDASSESAFPGAESLLEAATRVGGHAALGGRYPLTGRLSARIQASTRVFRTPFSPMVEGIEVGRSDTVVLTSAAPAGHGFADSAIELVRSTRLELGLTYAIAGAGAARPGRSGSGETPSVPRR